jgi:hypothetical protein
MAQKILQQSREAENALADALVSFEMKFGLARCVILIFSADL